MLFLRVIRRPAQRSISKGFARTSLLASRNLHTTVIRRDRSFTNVLADDDNPPPVQVSSLSDNGILLADGLLVPGACIFLEGKVYLWDTPALQNNMRTTTQEVWRGWAEERFQIFDVVTPRPGGPRKFNTKKKVFLLFMSLERPLFLL